MKFLCDNCKAKYQIADEKVAGKTVRMKCRKCGHQIEVRSAVTETSHASVPPSPAPLPGVKAPPPRQGLATSLSATKPKPSQTSMPAQSGLASAFNKSVEDAPASSLAGRDAGIALNMSDEWYVAINGVPVGPVRISELRRKAATGAVTEESLCWQEGLEEWRPIRSIPDLAQLVREAAAGGNRGSIASIGEMPAVSPAPPPAPVAPAPAPAAARQSVHPSAPKQPVARPSTVPPAPLAPTIGTAAAPPRPAFSNPPAPAPAPAPQRSNVVPLRPAAQSSFDDVMPVGGGQAAAFAPSLSPAFAPAAPQTSPMPLSSPKQQVAPPVTTPSPGVDPFKSPMAPSGPMPAASPFSLSPNPPPAMSLTPSYPDVGPARPSFHPSSPSFAHVSQPIMAPPPTVAPVVAEKKGVPLWFWPILVLFLGFGGGLAFLVFRPQPAPAPVVIQMPATAAPTGSAAPAPTDSVAMNDIPSPSDTPETPAPATGSGKKPKSKGSTAPAPAEEKHGLDLGNLGGGVGGPSVGPSPNGGGGGGGGLDQAGVERVVSAHRAGVKRTCWERGGSDQKSSVNVTVTANVAPNGSVSSTSSSGDDPVVGKCIENQVRIWSFPAPGSPTTINIPFKFVRQ